MNKEILFMCEISDGFNKNTYYFVKIKFYKTCEEYFKSEVGKITKREFIDGTLKIHRCGNAAVLIETKNLLKDNNKKCKDCKFFTLCIRTNKKSENRNRQIAIATINIFFKKENCPLTLGDLKYDYGFEIKQIKECQSIETKTYEGKI